MFLIWKNLYEADNTLETENPKLIFLVLLRYTHLPFSWTHQYTSFFMVGKMLCLKQTHTMNCSGEDQNNLNMGPSETWCSKIIWIVSSFSFSSSTSKTSWACNKMTSFPGKPQNPVSKNPLGVAFDFSFYLTQLIGGYASQ